MTRAVTGIWWSPTAEGTPALVVTASFFTLGGLMGCFLAFRMAQAGTDAMTAYLDSFLLTAQAGGLDAPTLPELLWRSFRWPLAAAALGFSAAGLFGIPVLSFLRGFFLAFSIASFAQTYGYAGLAVAFFLLGIPGSLSIPAFFLLSVQSFSSACSMIGRVGRREMSVQRGALLRCGVCVAATCVSLLLECYLVPALISGSAGALLQ